MESCGMNFIKYLLFIFNLVFALSGVGIIVAGALVLADVSQHSHFMDSGILAPSIVLIVAGSIVFIIAFLGCFGAYRESRSMLMAFAGLLLVIFIIELAVGIAAACFKSDFQDGMKKSMSESLKNYNKEGTGDKEAWDNMQKMMMCCGTEGPFDWITDGPSRQLPHSCCHALKDGDEPPTEAQCRQAVASDAYVYQVGCFDKLQMKVKSAANVLIGVGIGIAFIEVIGIVLACWLASAIKKEEEK